MLNTLDTFSMGVTNYILYILDTIKIPLILYLYSTN